ncbi:MAG: N-acetylglucosamine-6-phosphate deacetylase [Terriglobales bacterium]
MVSALFAVRLCTPLDVIEDGCLLVRDGRVEAVGPRTAVAVPEGAHRLELGDVWLGPGLLDIHVHGGAGHDVMQNYAAGRAAMEKQMARHGVTGYLATTVSAPMDATLKSLEHLGRDVLAAEEPSAGGGGNGAAGRARPLGIHLEGPFISHVRRGAHPPEHLLAPSPELLNRMWDAAQGTVRLLTIAAELPGAMETIARARQLGIRVSLGHSDADGATTRAAIAAGATQTTHTFNAMPPLEHRASNLLSVALSDRRLMAELICDGIHVEPEVAAVFFRSKGPEGAILVTDGMSATGMPPGRYQLGGFQVEVRDGRAMIDEQTLAGSVLTLDRAVRNAAAFAGWPLPTALRLATRNPAQAMGWTGRGQLTAGAAADCIVLDAAGGVLRTFVGGQDG